MGKKIHQSVDNDLREYGKIKPSYPALDDVNTQLLDIVTVKGTTGDDIQSVLNSLGSIGGGKITLKNNGLYTLTKTLNIPPNVSIDGRNSKLLLSKDYVFVGVILDNGTNQVIENIVIEKENYNWYGNSCFVLKGNSKGTILRNIKTIGGAGIKVAPDDGYLSENIKIENCEGAYSKDYGIQLDNCKNVEIINPNFHHNWLDGIKTRHNTVNVNVRGGSASYNGQSAIVLNDPTQNGNGLDSFAGGDGLNIIDFTTEYNQGAGIYIKTGSYTLSTDPGFLGRVKDSQVSNCRCNFNRDDGLNINRSGGDSDPTKPLPANIIVNGGLYSNNTQSGVYIRGRNIVLNNPMCISNGTHGINIASAKDLQIISPLCIENGKTLAGNYNGVNAVNTVGLRIFGGIFLGVNNLDSNGTDYATLTKYTKYGIYISTGCDEILIEKPKIDYVSNVARIFCGMTSGVCIVNLGNWNNAKSYGTTGSTLIYNGLLYIKTAGTATSWVETDWKPIATTA